MSETITPSLVLTDKRLSAITKLIWATICAVQGEDGEAIISYRQISIMLGCGQVEAFEAIQQLAQLGYIEIERNTPIKGVNTYSIPLVHCLPIMSYSGH